MFEEYRFLLRERLLEAANPETKIWWENYVKESAPFLGVKMPVIRAIVHAWHVEEIDTRLDVREQVDLALALFDGEYTEEKLAGTIFLQEILLPSKALDSTQAIDRFAALFDGGKIYDWNTCDWFCVKVLGPLIQENGWAYASRIAEWRKAENLWRARVSLVAFVKVAGESDYYPMIRSSCQVLIRRPERFAKTAVGWVLRDISKYNVEFVRQVIEENASHFSAESIKNATKYFEKQDQRLYRALIKKV